MFRVRCDRGSGHNVPDVWSRRLLDRPLSARPLLVRVGLVVAAVVLVFVSVNQVLVRLWARVSEVWCVVRRRQCFD
jgi:hypothetical protein